MYRGENELAKRKLEPDELRQLVDAERASILEELSQLAADDAAAREKGPSGRRVTTAR